MINRRGNKLESQNEFKKKKHIGCVFDYDFPSSPLPADCNLVLDPLGCVLMESFKAQDPYSDIMSYSVLVYCRYELCV